MFVLWKNSLDGRWNRTIMERPKPPFNPMMGYLFVIYILSTSADTTLLPPCETKRPITIFPVVAFFSGSTQLVEFYNIRLTDHF